MVFLSGPPTAALINMEALFLLDLILTHIRVSKLKVALLLTNKLIPSPTKADRAVSVHQSLSLSSGISSGPTPLDLQLLSPRTSCRSTSMHRESQTDDAAFLRSISDPNQLKHLI
ncbi:hypothetical protein XENOCAPTIV_028601 [Xenoophorus captivus]|uniref:Uncharacterized protein n=1 Tax=Xenoophorus captivus TaxID=1517983 RepID=A0ABV0RSZ6_9TELE